MSSNNFTNQLLDWFVNNGRKYLPWQLKKSPYSVWISEIMLQQTQVKTVIPYYINFMKRFPNIESIAKCELDELLSYWSGLGYYARGRNIYKTAKILDKKYQSIFPKTYDEIIKLPGIGRSTAGAILALAYKKKYSILDGNVKRVLARYYRIEGFLQKSNIQEKLWNLADLNTPSSNVDQYTQAIMDLGATVCTRSRPKCFICPLSENCLARFYSEQDKLPTRKPRTKKSIREVGVMIIVDNKKSVLLEKRPNNGIWGGLYSFPELGDGQTINSWLDDNLREPVEKITRLNPIKHSFTHFNLLINPTKIKIENKPKKYRIKPRHFWHKLPIDREIGLAAPISVMINEL